MMTAESCQCQIPRPPNSGGMAGSHHSRVLSGGEDDIETKSPHSIGVPDGKDYYVLFKSTPAYASPDGAIFKDAKVTGQAVAGVPYLVMDYSYIMTDGELKAPGDWDAIVAAITDANTGVTLGWVQCTYFLVDKKGDLVEAYFGKSQATKAAPAADFVANGLKALSDAQYAIDFSQKELKAAAPGEAKDEEGGWSFDFSDAGTQDVKVTKEDKTASKDDDKDKGKTKAAASGGGLLLGLGALAAIALSKK